MLISIYLPSLLIIFIPLYLIISSLINAYSALIRRLINFLLNSVIRSLSFAIALIFSAILAGLLTLAISIIR